MRPSCVHPGRSAGRCVVFSDGGHLASRIRQLSENKPCPLLVGPAALARAGGSCWVSKTSSRCTHGQPAPPSETPAAESHLLDRCEESDPSVLPDPPSLSTSASVSRLPQRWLMGPIRSAHPFMHEGFPSSAGKATESFYFKLGTKRHLSRAANYPLLICLNV